MTTDQIINSTIAFFTGIAGISAAYAAWQSRQSQDSLIEESEKKFTGGLISQVYPEGTFIIRNETGENIIIKVAQERLAEDTKRHEGKYYVAAVNKEIDAEKFEDIARRIRRGGNTLKCRNMNLGNHEEMQVPDSAMYGYVLEDIKEVIIGTLVIYNRSGSKKYIQKLYIHRFTMGEGAREPRARWIQIASKVFI